MKQGIRTPEAVGFIDNKVSRRVSNNKHMMEHQSKNFCTTSAKLKRESSRKMHTK